MENVLLAAHPAFGLPTVKPVSPVQTVKSIMLRPNNAVVLRILHILIAITNVSHVLLQVFGMQLIKNV
jgi:hypothetical protein